LADPFIGRSRFALNQVVRIVLGSAISLAALTLALPSAAFAGYSGTAASQYADTYWNNYNGDYESFAPTDCTNFVSQALNWNGYEGGGLPWNPNINPPLTSNPATNLSDWYGETYQDTYTDPYYSNTWTVAADLFGYVANHVPGGSWNFTFSYYQDGTAPSFTPEASGSPLFFNWDAAQNGEGIFGISHAVIQVGGGYTSDGAYGSYVDSHNNNRYHAFWTEKFVSNPSNSDWRYEQIYGDSV
jgi:hypothetical protein